MSSDTFTITVRQVSGRVVELHCRTSSAGGPNDYAITRSFVLMVLASGMREYGRRAPLLDALARIGDGHPPLWEEDFHREHVGTFIDSTELVERTGVVEDIDGWMPRITAAAQAAEASGANINDAIERELTHCFVLRATVTDPRWLEGLRAGDQFGTTAFDAWWDDPRRPDEQSRSMS